MITKIVEASTMLVALLTSLYALYRSIRERKRDGRAVEARVGIDEKQQAKIANDIAVDNEGIYLKRVSEFKDDIKLLRIQLDDSNIDVAKIRRFARILEEFYVYGSYHDYVRKLETCIKDFGGELPQRPSWLVYLDERMGELNHE